MNRLPWALGDRFLLGEALVGRAFLRLVTMAAPALVHIRERVPKPVAGPHHPCPRRHGFGVIQPFRGISGARLEPGGGEEPFGVGRFPPIHGRSPGERESGDQS